MSKVHVILVGALFLIALSCFSTKPEKEIPQQDQFNNAMLSLEKKRYLRAQEEFGNIAVRGLHTDLGDDAQFYLAESYFLNKEYVLAIAEYDRLIRRMGFSEYVKKARWRISQCYVKQSPQYYHEQISTENALSKLQEFIDDYPNSEFKDEALATIDELRNKLAKKLYETGKLYVKMEEYQSAIITFEDLLSQYYDTNYVSDAHFQIIACYAKKGEIEKSREYLDLHINQINNSQLVAEAESIIEQYQ